MKTSPLTSPFTSPITSIHAIHPLMVMNKLKPIKDDFLHYVESQDSISQLSFTVNDSAGGKNFEDCYERQEVLGEGGFAVVYRCFHRERMHSYAVKEVFVENYECSGENLREEIDALKRLRDVPYIVRLHDIFTEPDATYMVMEEMKGGDLLNRLCEKEVFSEQETKKISRKLLEALYYCHRKHIVHRDIKPENILLCSTDNDTNVKLADFGCSKRITGKNCLHTLCGSPQYVAPEVYSHEYGYDERCDLWSAGVVIYVLLGGYAPFDAEEHLLPKLICGGQFSFHKVYWGDISEPPKDLIRSLLVVNPEKRAKVSDALDSEWLRRRDRDNLAVAAGNGSISSFDAWLTQHSAQEDSIGSLTDHGLDKLIEEDETEVSLSLDAL